jgi:hypothetical protein
MNDRTLVDDDRKLFNGDGTAAAVDADTRDASDPCGHGTLLAERGGDAESSVLGHGSGPAGLFRGTHEHRGLTLRTTHRVWRRARIATGAVQQRDAERKGSKRVQRLGNGAVDLPVDHRRPWRPAVGGGE